jgi:hypothetical protein
MPEHIVRIAGILMMIDGAGDLNTVPAFEASIGTLYGAAFTMKFSAKKTGVGPDYTVAPLSAQTMYVGPYCDEAPTIAAMHRFILEKGYSPRGRHHEIYMSDPRRTTPERLRTILRHPVSK